MAISLRIGPNHFCLAGDQIRMKSGRQCAIGQHQFANVFGIRTKSEGDRWRLPLHPTMYVQVFGYTSRFSSSPTFTARSSVLCHLAIGGPFYRIVTICGRDHNRMISRHDRVFLPALSQGTESCINGSDIFHRNILRHVFVEMTHDKFDFLF
jgi:hypothetical protein